MGQKIRLVAGLGACVIAATLMITGVVTDGVGLVMGTIAVLAMAGVPAPSGRRDNDGETS